MDLAGGKFEKLTYRDVELGYYDLDAEEEFFWYPAFTFVLKVKGKKKWWSNGQAIAPEKFIHTVNFSSIEDFKRCLKKEGFVLEDYITEEEIIPLLEKVYQEKRKEFKWNCF